MAAVCERRRFTHFLHRDQGLVPLLHRVGLTDLKAYMDTWLVELNFRQLLPSTESGLRTVGESTI